MKKFLSLLITLAMMLSMLPVTAAAAVTHAPDEHEFEYLEDIDSNSYYECNGCGTEAKLVKDFNGLVSAAESADPGEVLLLKAGTYVIEQQIDITKGNGGVTIIGQDEALTTIETQFTSKYHMFEVNGGSGDVSAELTLANVTLQGDAQGTKRVKAGVAIKNSAVVNLYHVTTVDIGENGWYGVQADNNYNSGKNVIVRAYDINTEDGAVKMEAAVGNTTKFFYDTACNTENIVIPSGHENRVFIAETVPIQSAVASVACAGITTGYASFEEAIAVVNEPNAAAGNYTITLLQDCDEKVTITQKPDVNITVKAKDDTIAFSGMFNLHGGSNATTSLSTLTFDGIHFDGSPTTAYQYFIHNENRTSHPHNITVQNCKFTDTGNTYRHAINLRQIYGTAETGSEAYCIQIQNCEFTDLAGTIWIKGNANGVIKNITVKDCVEGISTSDIDLTVSDSQITTTMFGVRYNVDSNAETLVEGCTITSPKPLWLRKENGDALNSYLTVSSSEENKSALIIAEGGEDVVHLSSKYTPLTMEQLLTPTPKHLVFEDCAISYADAIAKIDGKTPNGYVNFISIEEAKAAAVSGDTIVLIKDLALQADEEFDGINLDLNDNELTIPENMTLTVSGAAVKNGDLIVDGSIDLATVDATVEASAGLNVTTSVADSKVIYVSGAYVVVPANVVAKIGSTYYTALSDALTAVTADGTIELLQNSSESITVDKNMTLLLSGYEMTGTVALASGVVLSSDSENLTVTVPEAHEVVKGSTDGSFTYKAALTTYTITATAGEGGSITPSGDVTAEHGGSLAVAIAPQSGYRIKDVLVDDVSVGAVESYTFEAIAGGHTISAVFERIPTSSGGGSDRDDYTVSVPEAEKGTVELSSDRAEKGETVKVDVKPDAGYGVGKVTVITQSGKEIEVELKDGEYTFEMPAGGVEVKAEFVKTGSGFEDVPDEHWAYDEVAWADANDYMKGKTEDTFDPSGSTSRQQVWMILARHADGAPADMEEAKAWAKENNISDGTLPGGAVTRQQMVTLLYRYAVMMGYDVSSKADLSKYPDADAVSDYAEEAMAWAVANGIVNGTAEGTLNPNGTANRAQFAAILCRFCDKIS